VRGTGREAPHEQCQGRGRCGGRADAGERPRQDEPAEAGRRGGEEVADGEQRQAGQQDAASAVPVPEAAADEQQRSERHQVSRDRPLRLGGRQQQVRPQPRDGDVHDGHVQHEQELHAAQQRQDGRVTTASGCRQGSLDGSGSGHACQTY
jgi:hypothetical protein